MIDAATLEDWAKNAGYAIRRDDPFTWRLELEQPDLPPFYVQLGAHWIAFSILPILDPAADLPSDLGERLLAINRDIRVAKFAIGSAGEVVLCAELPCSPEDPEWRMSDEQLGQLVRDALDRAGLPLRAPVSRTVSRRLPQAYPIYTRDYRRHFERIDRWAGTLGRVTTFGRQGLFAHDNTHHALAMAYAASGCLNDDGDFDNERWAEHRRQFETHVVED